MHSHFRTLSLLSLLGLAACGGSNEGTGTKTLYVHALAQSDGTNEGTRIDVEIREGSSNGNIVSDAVVTVKSEKGTEFALPFNGVVFGNFKAGANHVDNIAWENGYELKISRGSDKLEAFIAGPGITTVTEPIGGTAFNRADGKPLALRWKDAAGRHADTTRVTFEKAKIDFTTDDDGNENVEANRLTVDTEEKLTVERSNDVDLKGGAAGSTFTAATRHRVAIVVQ